MQLIIAIKNESLIRKSGPYYQCYCGSMKLGTYNLIAHIATIKECGDKFTADLVNYYPPPPKHKWWQIFNRRTKIPKGPIPKLFLPGLDNPPVGPDTGVKIDKGFF